jgi:hypothetical protein
LVYHLNLFSKAFLERHRLKLLFIIVWLHISILDLFFITYRGPVFLWQENLQLLTLLVHFFIALGTTLIYWLVNKYLKSTAILPVKKNVNTDVEPTIITKKVK